MIIKQYVPMEVGGVVVSELPSFTFVSNTFQVQAGKLQYFISGLYCYNFEAARDTGGGAGPFVGLWDSAEISVGGTLNTQPYRQTTGSLPPASRNVTVGLSRQTPWVQNLYIPVLNQFTINVTVYRDAGFQTDDVMAFEMSIELITLPIT